MERPITIIITDRFQRETGRNNGTPEAPSLSKYQKGSREMHEADLVIAYRHWYPTQGQINWGTLPRFTVLKDRYSTARQNRWLQQNAVTSELTETLHSTVNAITQHSKNIRLLGPDRKNTVTYEIRIEKLLGDEDFKFSLTRGEFLALISAMEENSKHGNSPIAKTAVLEHFKETHRGTILGDKLSIV